MNIVDILFSRMHITSCLEWLITYLKLCDDLLLVRLSSVLLEIRVKPEFWKLLWISSQPHWWTLECFKLGFRIYFVFFLSQRIISGFRVEISGSEDEIRSLSLYSWNIMGWGNGDLFRKRRLGNWLLLGSHSFAFEKLIMRGIKRTIILFTSIIICQLDSPSSLEKL